MAQRPALFDRAFTKLFDAATLSAAASSRASDGSSSRSHEAALARFWTASASAAVGAAAASPPPPPPAAAAAASSPAQLSRYQTDFEERCELGAGSFGQVVLAVNRLDGRKYAVKRVRLSQDSGLNAKILREVATLSRLEHVSVVRYYQAWVESAQAASSDGGGSDGSDSDGSGSGGGGSDSSGGDGSAGWDPSLPSPRCRDRKRMLFIQMEYCRTTLREARAGPSPSPLAPHPSQPAASPATGAPTPPLRRADSCWTVADRWTRLPPFGGSARCWRGCHTSMRRESRTEI